MVDQEVVRYFLADIIPAKEATFTSGPVAADRASRAPSIHSELNSALKSNRIKGELSNCMHTGSYSSGRSAGIAYAFFIGWSRELNAKPVNPRSLKRSDGERLVEHSEPPCVPFNRLEGFSVKKVQPLGG